ncbi:uncharacterized protein A4U43_C09F6950 [Asparagus officinalis]|uniref:J domain-containing protein n=1 Tax=Asparagus officinalis TaxID=4686 RepID=A0A5P1E5V0_ASPOF|nr:dnaJ homolog subfamily B member 13-like [Asparagus officinalis]ONK58014.1 uncharacterized protein A4U43_C09F6950 [Asparagus officinalis]
MANPSKFYEVLNLSEDSSPQEIRKAYKILAKKWHPDKHPVSSKREAEAKFKAISQAYEALSDQEFTNKASVHGNTHLNLKRSCSSVSNDVKRKPMPKESKLECTLEELFWGCKKEVKFTRDVVTNAGWVLQKQECHTITVKPGWRKGTKIIFDSMGDEMPGFLPADIVFLISEKYHPLFKRIGDNLVLKVKVTLANALTGWSFTFRLIDGEKISCYFHNEIIFPGYEKVIKGKGMPIANKHGARGDLIIKFHVVFPRELSGEQRKCVVELLKESN